MGHVCHRCNCPDYGRTQEHKHKWASCFFIGPCLWSLWLTAAVNNSGRYHERWLGSASLSWLIVGEQAASGLRILWLQPTTGRKLITTLYKSMNNWMCQLPKESWLFTAVGLRQRKGRGMLDPEDPVEDKVVPCLDSANTPITHAESAGAKG